MALSNAIVPILPVYATSSTLQSAIYSAYFLGAFLTTLLGGLLSDKYGRLPVIRFGLGITIISGLLLTVLSPAIIVIGARCLEGIGAGLFVAAAMAHVNSLPDHAKMSGYFMAALNLGLVLGLILGGNLAVQFHTSTGGILLFTIMTLLSILLSIFMMSSPATPEPNTLAIVKSLIYDYRWLWYSSLVLIGITGVVTSLYPKFSGASPDIVGNLIAGMSIATIMGVITISRINPDPIITIQIAAAIMAGSVMLTFISPIGFFFIGTLSGFVMIAQMAFLSKVKDNQGITMGLFSTTSYLGMSLLPFLAGVIADSMTFFIAFCVTACMALTVTFTISRYNCPN
jgi:MFS family permease